MVPVLAIALSLVAVPAQAQEQGPQYAPTMLVLDASGSMKGAKMDAAKSAVHTFVDSVPAPAEVGLEVYGTHTGSSDAEKTAGCQDVQVLQAPQRVDKASLNGAVDGITPSGYTPIGVALTKAAETLPKEGPRSIVLVSDGLDTCSPPDPCEIAKKLTQQGTQIVMHTIGYGVDDQSRAQLTCIAQATGGTYSDAPDGKALEKVLPRVSSVALRNYESAGAQITGTAGWRDAPVAGAGQYLDTLGQKETRYYAIDVPQGATAYFSGTLSFPRLDGINQLDDFNTLQLRVYGENGQDCYAFDTAQATKSSDGVALTISKAWTKAAEEKGKCTGGGRYYFALTWDRVSAGVPERLPVELLVGIEPAATDPGPAAVLPKTSFAEPASAAQPVIGGGSFNVAGSLPGNGNYTDTLQRGEYVFYRVHLDWGQGLAYKVRFGQTGGRGLDNLSAVTTTLYSPYRDVIDRDYGSYNGSESTLPNEKALATVPVRYGNRNADVQSARSQSIAGTYYIAVQVGPTTDEGANQPVPVTLELTVGGKQEAGPTYATAAGPGIFGDKSEKQMTEGLVVRTDEKPASSSTGWILALVFGGLVLLAAIFGGVLVSRRRA
ncbi:vWA domain-containing protein [Amycolatopsis acidicola]|uniref:vWA domain-containing protein n=1 Tax=Amycolatopsis acidicola TaxID=2596893 RepID=UPI001AA0225E|nr:VWA domain-containing protein [Amycolatopsis acidicola]